MLKRILTASIFIGIISGCQQDEMVPMDDVFVTEIVEEDLPQSALTFIEENFEGEVVTSSFRINDGGEVLYETILTNQMNLVFSENGRIRAFGEEGAEVDCEGRHRRRWGLGLPPRGDGEYGLRPIVVDPADLPDPTLKYMRENYPENQIIKIIFIERNELNQYFILVKEIGILVFNEEGEFLKLKERPLWSCPKFDRIEIVNIRQNILSYIKENYPDSVILRARMGIRNKRVEIHVLVYRVGVLIFDKDGEFIELKTCGMNND